MYMYDYCSTKTAAHAQMLFYFVHLTTPHDMHQKTLSSSMSVKNSVAVIFMSLKNNQYTVELLIIITTK